MHIINDFQHQEAYTLSCEQWEVRRELGQLSGIKKRVIKINLPETWGGVGGKALKPIKS